jgi:hypothetical protein
MSFIKWKKVPEDKKLLFEFYNWLCFTRDNLSDESWMSYTAFGLWVGFEVAEYEISKKDIPQKTNSDNYVTMYQKYLNEIDLASFRGNTLIDTNNIRRFRKRITNYVR